MKTLIQLEDLGQDLTSLTLDDKGKVIQESISRGLYINAIVPLDMVKEGEELPIHHPPHIRFGFLKYKVTKIIKNHQGND